MAENPNAAAAPKHTTLVFIAVTATTAAVTYNSLAVITAIPAMKAEFEMSLTMTQWIMNGYTLAAAALVAAMGRFGDIFGHMRVIIFGMSCFLLGSFTMLLAADTAVAIAGRVLQGIGAAAILSSSLAILNDAVPEDKRAAAIGLWGAVVSLGIGLGTTIGGVLTAFNWRAVFAFDVLLVLPALIVALRVMSSVPRSTDGARHFVRFRGDRGQARSHWVRWGEWLATRADVSVQRASSAPRAMPKKTLALPMRLKLKIPKKTLSPPPSSPRS